MPRRIDTPSRPARTSYLLAGLLALPLVGPLAFALLVPWPHTENRGKVPDDGFLVAPYLQLPTPSGMTVMWETEDALPSRVEYGSSLALGQAVYSPQPVKLHELRLEDLESGTTYYYRVLSGDIVSETYAFRTAPPPGTRRWRMALYGDSRTNPKVHALVVEQIRKARVDLIVHTGDIVTNGKDHASWRQQFFEPLRPLARSVPWVSTIGNHEQDDQNYFSYVSLPGKERYYGFDYANAHIVCLDSNAVQVKVRDAEQFDWLVDHLKKRSREPTWTFVIFHHPLFSAHPSRAISDLRWVWAPLFLDPANRVDGVLTGHDHFYARNFRMGTLADGPQQGVLFLTSAGGGASLYPCSARDYVASERSAHHFTLFDFDGDHVTLMAIDTTGKEFDHYVLTKDPTPPEEFCSYEVEEFRQFLRKALAITPAPVGQNASQPAEVDVAWTVPTRFKVPVAGMLRWQPKAGWDLKEAEVPFQLDAGQALHIPLRATVAAGPLAGSPKLTIVFEPGRFHNHTVEAYPQILGGPSTVTISRAGSAVRVDGNLDETVWRTAPHLSLAGLPPRGGRSDRLQVVADSERIYFGAQVDNVAGNIGVKVGPVRLSRADVLVGESLRVTLTDGKRTHRLTVSPGGLGYVDGDKTEPTVWQAAVGTARGGWAAELSVSRRLFADWSSVSLNVVHRQPTSKEAVEWQLCPGFTLGNSPDRIPDVRPAEIPARYARIRLE